MAELADPGGRAPHAAACREAAAQLGMDRHVEELLQAYQELTAKP
jgi:hypothetical protein